MEKQFDYKTIKTFEDACEKLDIDPDDINDMAIPSWLKATWKLETIFKSINNGWEPDWNNVNEKKWYPNFNMPYVSFNDSSCIIWNSDSEVSSRFCTYSIQVSDYIGKTFDYLYQIAFTIKK